MTLESHHLRLKILFQVHLHDHGIESIPVPIHLLLSESQVLDNPAILINGFGKGYGDTGDHFAVTDEGKVIYTTVQEGYKEGIEWLHKLVTEDPVCFLLFCIFFYICIVLRYFIRIINAHKDIWINIFTVHIL